MVAGPPKAGSRLAMAPPRSEIAHYLRIGERDILFKAWPRNHVLDRCQRGTADLRRALVREVKLRTMRVAMAVPEAVEELDCEGFARKKVAPMVRGLFPIVEQQVLLDTLARSLVYLTSDTIEAVLNQEDHGTAWDLANMYLLSCGAKLLADDAPRAVRISVGTTCFVSMDNFRANHWFADFEVHEAAHIFHTCKRRARAAGDEAAQMAARDRLQEARELRLRV